MGYIVHDGYGNLPPWLYPGPVTLTGFTNDLSFPQQLLLAPYKAAYKVNDYINHRNWFKSFEYSFQMYEAVEGYFPIKSTETFTVLMSPVY